MRNLILELKVSHKRHPHSICKGANEEKDRDRSTKGRNRALNHSQGKSLRACGYLQVIHVDPSWGIWEGRRKQMSFPAPPPHSHPHTWVSLHEQFCIPALCVRIIAEAFSRLKRKSHGSRFWNVAIFSIRLFSGPGDW